ncbi:hypothetical protein D1632_15665 [Chryseobacterium nematophagum]|uniref:Uncharacterized protein n=1 Tax=Chryseobacterium nematophagum TaxID=2305228 RepID=A0A3M7L895_9FLAO|nr:hypothetical protein [Chryseobacterium nematophagum]RMZ59001.1 hypothetical protein D1632_15665 [Chryseobacterium nematophagum]
MRNCIIYFLVSLFTLFIVESKINVKTFQNDHKGHVSHHHHIPQRENRVNQNSIQQSLDELANAYSGDLEEDDFKITNTLQTIVVFSNIFSLVYVFGLKSFKKKRPNINAFLSNLSIVKRFILMRTIRI